MKAEKAPASPHKSNCLLKTSRQLVSGASKPGSRAAQTSLKLYVKIILDPSTPDHGPLSEALLFSAARADHLEKTIRPALEDGNWVLCDRFADSTRAYQGAAGGLQTNMLLQLERLVIANTPPNLTLILDLDVTKAFDRVAKRKKDQQVETNACDDAYERRNQEFHEALRQGFLAIAQAEPERCVVIDAEPEQPHIAEQIWQCVHERLLKE